MDYTQVRIRAAISSATKKRSHRCGAFRELRRTALPASERFSLIRLIQFVAGGLVGLLTYMAAARPVAQQPEMNGHCVWLAERIREVEAVRVGMTRREVMKVLQEDQGGEEAFVQRKSFRYQHPACEYIKLDVSFKLARSSKTSSNYLEDTVSKVSQPFLDLVPNRARF